MAKLSTLEGAENNIILDSVEKSYPQTDRLKFQSFLLCRQLASEMDSVLEGFFSEYSMSCGRFTLLMLLDQAPMGLMPSELANCCGVTQATISGLLNGLEKNEIIQRQTHHQDGRAYVIKLTEKGRSLYHQVQPNFLKTVDQMFNGFSREEVDLLQKLMGKLHVELTKLGQLN